MARLHHYLAFLILFAGVAAHVPAAPVRDGQVEVEMVSSVDALVPGRTVTVAVSFRHDPEWHTYWRNPGESGLATAISWSLPEGFSAGAIRWPVPKYFEMGGLASYGYGGSIHLLVDIVVPEGLQPGGDVELKADVDWLMCRDVCEPGSAQLALSLPVAAAAGPGPGSAAIAAARAQLALAPDGYEMSLLREGGEYRLALRPGPDLPPLPGELFFFSADARIDPGKPQRVERIEDGAVLLLPASSLPPLDGAGDRFRGVLASRDGAGFGADGEAYGIAVDLPVGGGSVGTAVTGAGGPGLLSLVALAFFGGLVLNLMPCVFPVLGIKIMGFVNHAGAERGRVVAHGLVFTAGVLLSFWVLAGVLIALRSAGTELGWGFQLQSPGFVFFLTALLLAFGLNMSGLFEVGLSAVGAGSSLMARKGFAGSFFSGVLATLVATPCAAPFLAPALGAALVLPAVQSLAVFTVIAVGLALPYLVFSVFPGLVSVLPKPGAWMETFKQCMAFLLYGTVAYLIWVLVGLLDESRQLAALFGLVAVALACWVYGRWSVPARRPGVRWAARGATLALVAAALWLGLAKPSKLEWEAWSEARVEELVAAGRPVYVDFTARWCATCQVNKRVVFGSGEVLRYFDRNKVAALKADWTRQDPAITRALAALGRQAVPVNLVYRAGESEPLMLPEVLTPGASALIDASRAKPNGPSVEPAMFEVIRITLQRKSVTRPKVSTSLPSSSTPSRTSNTSGWLSRSHRGAAR